jgi:hypothetical protein
MLTPICFITSIVGASIVIVTINGGIFATLFDVTSINGTSIIIVAVNTNVIASGSVVCFTIAIIFGTGIVVIAIGRSEDTTR